MSLISSIKLLPLGLTRYIAKMPALKIFTNISKSEIPKDFIQKFLPVLAKCTGKPLDKFVVAISADCILNVNETDQPSVISSLESIGHLGPEKNQVIARDITDYMAQRLGVEKNRIFLTFYDLESYNVAKNGRTIATSE